jgi:hypothetical protein
MIRRTIGDVLRLYRGSWWRVAVIELLTGVVLAAIAYVLLVLSGSAVSGLRSVLTSGGRLNPVPVLFFGLVVLLVFLLTCLPVLLGGVAAVIRVTDEQLAGRRPAIFRSLGGGLRAGARMSVGVVFSLLALILLFVLAPAITVLGLLGLVLTPLARLVRHRRPGFADRWPSVRELVWTAIPFGLAARWLPRVLVFVPAASLDPADSDAAMRATAPIVRGRRVFIVVAVLVAILLSSALSAGATALGTLLGGDLGGSIAQVVAQVLFLSLPIVVLAVVYRLGAAVSGGTGLPGSRTEPYAVGVPMTPRPKKTPGTLSPVWTRRIAIVMPMVLVVAGLAVAPLSANAVPASATLTVTSAADDTDAATLAQEQTNCEAATGTCTLRAALNEAAVLSVAGATSAITIAFSGDFTIPVTAGSPLAFNNFSGAAGSAPASGTLTIDGLGHAVTIDGQNAVQDLTLFSHRWDFVVEGLELRNGDGGQGGGLSVGDGRTVLVDSVTFDHDFAVGGGGLYAGGIVTVQNSTFAENSLAVPDGNNVPGGADIFGAGTVHAVNDTFAGSSGGAIFNWSSQGHTMSLDNSLVAIDASAAHGGFDCSGGGITGGDNVALSDNSCPGVTVSAQALIGSLARVNPDAPPVVNLLPSYAEALGTGGVGAGAVACPGLDERGRTRPASGCDLGAYEFDPASTITLTSSENPSTFGDSVVFTARVAAAEEPTTISSGTVQFIVDDAPAGDPVTVGPDGTATFAIGTLTSGAHRIAASYAPGAGGSYTASSTATALTETVQSSGSPVTISSDRATAPLGGAVTFTIAVGASDQVVTGTVTLTDITAGSPGTVVASNVPLSGGAATVTTGDLPVGPRVLVASYSGDGNNAPGVSGHFAEDIQAPSEIHLGADTSSAAYGAPVTFSATVTGSAGGPPTGTVEFTYGPEGASSTTVALDGDGIATLALSALDVGSDSVTADYLGDPFHQGGVTDSSTVQITPASTATVLSTDPVGPVAYGVPVTLSAVVSTTTVGSTADPAGTVTFSTGGTTLGTGALVGNGDGTATASYTTTTGQLPTGTDPIDADYASASGSGFLSNFVASAAPSHSLTVGHADTAVTVGSDAATAPVGQLVTLTATVTATGGSLATPTGTVTFTEGDSALGTATLSGGVATLGVATLGLGDHDIIAGYSANGPFAASSSTVFTEHIDQAQTTTTVDSTPASTVFGQAVTFDVTVVGDSGGSPDGTVALTDAGRPVADITVTDGLGSATLSGLSVGTHHLVATFVGDDGYLPSSGSADYSVTSAGTATALTLSPATSVFGDTVTFTAVVSNTGAASTAVPEGTVVFSQNGTVVGTAPVTPGDGTTGTASFSTGSLPQSSSFPRGQLPITAEFLSAGTDADFATSSDTQQAVVQQGTTRLTLAVTPGTVGSTVTATATIAVTSGHGSPTGSVQFSYGDSQGGTVPVVDGEAVLSGILLPVGQHTITAVYTSGDANFLAGGPAGVQVVIGQAAPTVLLSGSATGPIAYGAADTLTADIPVASGPSPTGTVTFTAVGPQGGTVLGSIPLVAVSPLLLAPGAGESKAVFVANDIPVGAQQIVASYGGDLSYSMASSSSIAQTVIAAGTTTTVTASPEPSAIRTLVTITATVTGSTGAVPTGTVAFSLDGVLLGSSALDAGVASVTTTPQAAGSPEVVATFTPSDGDFTGSSGTTTHDVELIPTTVSMVPDIRSAGVGQPVSFTVSVIPSPGFQAVTSSLPAGTITVGDGEGNECTTGVQPGGTSLGEVDGSCSIAWTATGDHQVTATYTGDADFAGGSTSAVGISVGKLAPTMSLVSSTDRAWVTGETTTLFWSVAGPSVSDGQITITTGATTVCTTTVLAGSCDYTFPAGAGGPATFVLHYSGDADWISGTASATQQVTACLPFVAPTALPAEGGTVAVQNTPDCDGGTGFLAGDTVTFTATPNSGYSINGWLFGTDHGTSATVTVSYPGTVTDTVLFGVGCVTVTISTLSHNAAGGSVTSQDPNCGQQPRTWQGSGTTRTGSFQPGTALALTARAASQPSAFDTFYQWDGLAAGADAFDPTTVLDVTAGQNLRVTAEFGIVCYHDISFPTPVGGTATIGAPNCTDPNGPGYAEGSHVPVSTRAIGSGYFIGWGPQPFVQQISDRADHTGSSGSLFIGGDDIVVDASYGGCVQFSVATAGTLSDGTPLGSASAGLAGNCPSQGAGWYTVGSTVPLTAKPTAGHTFAGWSGLPLLGPSSEASSTTAVVQLWTSGTETATFFVAMHCVPFTLVSEPAGALTLSAGFQRGTGTCPAGTYDESLGGGLNDSNPVTVTATATAGHPAIGWSGKTGMLDSDDVTQPVIQSGAPGSTQNLNVYGATTLTAWACESLDAQLTLISPNGTPHTTPVPENTDFIDVAPVPDCAWGSSNYTIGQSVFPQAGGDSAGYSFVGWSGAITGDSEFPTTPVVLDGTEPVSSPLVATYQVQCYSLTTNFDNVAVLPAPNCPDTPASEHEYIGGTAVTLQQTGDGSLVFRGWTGSPDGTYGSYAISQMNSDSTVYADYTAKSTGEKVSDAFSSVGTAISNAGKKLVGVAGAIVSGLILGSNPITAIGGIAVLLGKAVQGVADLLGVSSGGLVAFENGIDDISTMMTFITASTQCATVWSATSSSDDSPPSSASATGEGQLGNVLAKNELANQKAAALAAERAAQQEAISASSSTVGEAKVLAGRLGTVGAVAAGVYSAFGTDSGGDWSDTPTEAWSNGDAYMTCYEKSIPSYFGLPPVEPGD